MSAAASDATSIPTIWPAEFPADALGVSAFAVREVPAPASAVFEWLLRPDLHTEFYRGLRGVKVVGGPGPKIAAGSRVTFFLGALLVPPVKVVQADERAGSLAWMGGGPGLTACHAFTVAPVDEHRCLLRSEEKFVGPVARLGAAVIRGPLQKIQTDWAEAVTVAATRYPAGPPSA